MIKKTFFARLLLILNILQLVAPLASLHAQTTPTPAINEAETLNLRLPTRRAFKELSQSWEGLAPAAYVKDTSDASVSGNSRDELLKFVGAQHAALRKTAKVKPLFEALSFLHDLASPGKAIENLNCTKRLMTDMQVFGDKGLHDSITRTCLALGESLQWAQLYEGADSAETAAERRDFTTGILKKPDVARALTVRLKCFGQYENQFLRQTNAPRNKYLEKRIKAIQPSAIFGRLRNSSWFLKHHARITQKTAHWPIIGFDSIRAAYIFSSFWIALSLGARGLAAGILKESKENLLYKLATKAVGVLPSLQPPGLLQAVTQPTTPGVSAGAVSEVVTSTGKRAAQDIAIQTLELTSAKVQTLRAAYNLCSSSAVKDSVKSSLKGNSLLGAKKIVCDLAVGPYLPLAVLAKSSAPFVKNKTKRAALNFLLRFGPQSLQQKYNLEAQLDALTNITGDDITTDTMYFPSMRLDGYKAIAQTPENIRTMVLNLIRENPDSMKALLQSDPRGEHIAANTVRDAWRALDLFGLQRMRDTVHDTEEAGRIAAGMPGVQQALESFTPATQVSTQVFANIMAPDNQIINTVSDALPSATARTMLPSKLLAWWMMDSPIAQALRIATGQISSITNPAKRWATAFSSFASQYAPRMLGYKDIIEIGGHFTNEKGALLQLVFHPRPKELLGSVASILQAEAPTEGLFSVREVKITQETVNGNTVEKLETERFLTKDEACNALTYHATNSASLLDIVDGAKENTVMITGALVKGARNLIADKSHSRGGAHNPYAAPAAHTTIAPTVVQPHEPQAPARQARIQTEEERQAEHEEKKRKSEKFWMAGGVLIPELVMMATCSILGTIWAHTVTKTTNKAFDINALDEHMFLSLKPTVALAEMTRQISQILYQNKKTIPLPQSLQEKLNAIISTTSPECREFSKAARNPLFLRKKLPGTFGDFGTIRRAYQLADLPGVRQWLSTCAVFMAELDSYLAIARLAVEHKDHPNYYSPVEFINEEKPHVELTGFWFPIISSFIAISNNITIGNPSHILLTGINGGGKSIALKGMIFSILMAHAFGYAPLRDGKMTFFSKIITHLSSTDNAAEGESCWIAEAKSMGKALHEMQAPHKPGELILYVGDELGSGTADHAAIASVAQFIEVCLDSPHVASIISTHLRPLTQLEQISNGKVINYRVGGTVDGEGTIQRKYRVERGIADINIAELIVNQLIEHGQQKTAIHPDNLPS